MKSRCQQDGSSECAGWEVLEINSALGSKLRCLRLSRFKQLPRQQMYDIILSTMMTNIVQVSFLKFSQLETLIFFFFFFFSPKKFFCFETSVSFFSLHPFSISQKKKKTHYISAQWVPTRKKRTEESARVTPRTVTCASRVRISTVMPRRSRS